MKSKVSLHILGFWITISAVLLCAIIAIYVCSMLRINVTDRYPIVRFLYVSFFAPAIAAILYCRKIGGQDSHGQEHILQLLPPPMRFAVKALFVFAFVNFAIMMLCAHGGQAVVRDGKYLLINNDKILRVLTREEFALYHNYDALALSGAIICATYTVLALLLGVRKALSDNFEEQRSNSTHFAKLPTVANTSRYERDYVARSVISLVLYTCCAGLILTGGLFLSALCVLPASISAGLAIQRRLRDRSIGMRNMLGCLSTAPNAFLGAIVAERVAKFVYILIYCGMSAAVHEEVTLEFSKNALAHLSNGVPVNSATWGAMLLLLQVPIFAVVTTGLIHLAENIGELLQGNRSENSVSPPINLD